MATQLLLYTAMQTIDKYLNSAADIITGTFKYTDATQMMTATYVLSGYMDSNYTNYGVEWEQILAIVCLIHSSYERFIDQIKYFCVTIDSDVLDMIMQKSIYVIDFDDKKKYLGY